MCNHLDHSAHPHIPRHASWLLRASPFLLNENREHLKGSLLLTSRHLAYFINQLLKL